MILAIDFDGTIVRGEYPAIDGLMPDARKYMCMLKNKGHYIIINTCRTGNELLEAINYLLQEGIPFDRVNDNHPDMIAQHGGNSRKIFADVYIDDRNVFGFPGWAYAFKAIEKDPEFDYVTFLIENY